MNPILHAVLSVQNSHPRDADIQFFEVGHRYSILTDSQSKYTSVTTWNHNHFPHFNTDEVISSMMNGKGWKEGHKYWGLSPEQIKSQWNSNKTFVAESGTNLHFQIECFMNNSQIAPSYTNKDLYEFYMENNSVIHNSLPLEWQYFINFIKDHPNLKPYRTEWLIYNEDIKIAGSIDMIYENPDGTLSIYDWKRAKNITKRNNFNKFAINPIVCHLPDSNFWHYTMQLNTYKSILELKYNKKIKDLFLVRLHPDASEKNYDLIKLPILAEEINDLFTERKIQISS
jgi:ATP-dependent exoDNAse (exonuclease V) beta subunit